jgi:hypothetical protein
LEQSHLAHVAVGQNWFETLPSSQLVADLAISFWALVAWAAWDAPRTGVRTWWVTIPASLLVGVCFALPLYLLLRERKLAIG